MNLIGAGASGDRDVGAGIAAFFGGGVGGGDLEFLDVVRVQAEDIVGRVGIGTLVGLDAIDGDVDRRSARAVDVDGVAGALHHAGLVHQKVERIAAVERQVDHGLLLDDVAESGRRGLERLGGGGHLNTIGGGTDFHGEVGGEWRVHLNDVPGADERAESRGFRLDRVGADRDGREGIDAALGAGLLLHDAGGLVGESYSGTRNDGAGRIAHGAGNLGSGSLGTA